MLANIVSFILSNQAEYNKAITLHVLISVTAILVSIVIAVPLGILMFKKHQKLYIP